MVSLGLKLAAGSVTFLSMPTALPRSIETTWKGGGGGGAGGGAGACAGGGGGGAGGGGLLQARMPTTAARRPRAGAPRRRDMGTFLLLKSDASGERFSWLESSGFAPGR